MLSRYETAASGNAIDRDCGFSAPLPGRPGGSVWLFCDTVWTGARRGLWLGATAATGPALPGRVPTGLTELPTPAGAGIAAAPSPPGPGAAPQGFLGTPPGLVLPGGAPCRVPGTAYSASWVSGAARPPGTGALLVAYTDVCVHGTTISTQGFGLVEYRPGENALTGRARVFSLPAGLPFQQNLGSPVFSGGYLYLFASVCDAHGPGACLGGRVTLARVRADPSAWRDPAAYEYRTSGGWTRDAFQASTVVAGRRPLRRPRRRLHRAGPGAGHGRAARPGRPVPAVARARSRRAVAGGRGRDRAVLGRVGAGPVPRPHRASRAQHARCAAAVVLRPGRRPRHRPRRPLVTAPHPQSLSVQGPARARVRCSRGGACGSGAPTSPGSGSAGSGAAR
ncbi:DUF4185 domain-containing protein [Actinomadura madurae]|uniref:DUF4185 domain-containing protein n=1 Tax=Actinomadura madurae TaxID=1993 RepID=UPI0020D1F97E|nr:DUF4185 domain-containing protein [Actinomadura madurae]MCQ0013179.1 DUF4185 domain-containing protein [Actinomadura madurae]